MRDRRARHLAAARYFEALGDEELAGALATHYSAAYQAAAEGPEAHALAGQARIALRAAGARARALGSLEQAISYFENAGRLPGAEMEQLALLETAADIGMESGRYARAEPLYREIAERAVATGDRGMAARVTAGIAEAAFQADADRAVELATKAAEDFADLGSGDRDWLSLQMFLAQAAVRRGTTECRGDRRIDHDQRRADTGRGADPHWPRHARSSALRGGPARRGARRARGRAAACAGERLSPAREPGTHQPLRPQRRRRRAGRPGHRPRRVRDAMSRGLRSHAAFFNLNATEYDLHLGTLLPGIERTRSMLDWTRGIRPSGEPLHAARALHRRRRAVEDLGREIDGFRAERVSTDDDRRCWRRWLPATDRTRSGMAWPWPATTSSTPRSATSGPR